MGRTKLQPDGTGVVYAIKCVTTGRVYVGQAQTERLLLRWDRHKSNLRHGRHHSLKLQRAWNKYGEDSFEFNIIESSIPIAQLTEREQHYMDTLCAYADGFNCTPVAACTRGVKQSPETIAKRVEKLKIILKGRHVSEETKAKIRQARANQVFTPESIEKRAAKQRGVKTGPNPKKGRKPGFTVSEETKRKIRETKEKRGPIPISEETRQKMREAQNRPENLARKKQPLSDEHRKKLSEAHQGSPSGMKGKKHSEEAKQKMREKALARRRK